VYTSTYPDLHYIYLLWPALYLLTLTYIISTYPDLHYIHLLWPTLHSLTLTYITSTYSDLHYIHLPWPSLHSLTLITFTYSDLHYIHLPWPTLQNTSLLLFIWLFTTCTSALTVLCIYCDIMWHSWLQLAMDSWYIQHVTSNEGDGENKVLV